MFTAMLQARPDQHLVPKTQCYLQSSETNMTIGLAVFMHKGKSSAIIVVENKPIDDDAMRQTKELIRAMTPIVPKQKFANQDMAEIFNVLLELGIIACFLPKN